MEDIKKYIDNPVFIQWVFDPNDDINEYWDFYINKHKEEKIKLVLLKKELELFSISNQKLTEERRQFLMNKIACQIGNRKKSGKVRAISRSILKYAAIALLFISIGGGIVYFYQENIYNNQVVDYFEIPQISDKPMIAFSDGSTIDLDANESEVKYTANNKLVVNNNRVVDLPSENEEITSSLVVQSIPYGYRSKIVLNDKTTVWLNAGSRLIYPSSFIGDEREVTLFGEAFFEVAKDEQKPFIVRTSDYRVNVLGTKFNVSAYPGDNISQTVLTEGSVKLQVNDGGWFDRDIVLKPNEMFSYNKKLDETRIQRINPEMLVSWKDGIIICEKEDLSRVIKKLERFYNIRMELDNPLDGTIQIDGKLNLKEDKNEVLYYVSKVAKRKFIEKNEKHYIIK